MGFRLMYNTYGGANNYTLEKMGQYNLSVEAKEKYNFRARIQQQIHISK